MAPESIRGSGRQREGARPGLAGRPLLSRAPKYIQQGLPARVHTFPRMSGKPWGRGGEKIQPSRLHGCLQRSLGHSVTGSSQAAKKNGKGGRQGGRRESWEGSQAAATSGCVATSVFWKRRTFPPPPRSTPCPCRCLFHTKFQDPQKTHSAAASSWGRQWARGGSLFLPKLGWQPGKVTSDARTSGLAAVFSGVRREPSSQGSAWGFDPNVRKACRVCWPGRRQRPPCR